MESLPVTVVLLRDRRDSPWRYRRTGTKTRFSAPSTAEDHSCSLAAVVSIKIFPPSDAHVPKRFPEAFSTSNIHKPFPNTDTQTQAKEAGDGNGHSLIA